MKLYEIFKEQIDVGQNFKIDQKSIWSSDPIISDKEEYSGIQKIGRIKVKLYKPIEDENVRFVKLSFYENNMRVPEGMKMKVYDTLIGFYRTELDFGVDKKGYASKLRSSPTTDIYFAFDKRSDVDVDKKRLLINLLERNSIPYFNVTALDQLSNDERKSFDSRSLQYKKYESGDIVSIPYSAFEIVKTSEI